MTEQERSKLLISLGYNEASIGKWLKPVGKHLLSFETETNLWTNWYIDKQGNTVIYHAHEYDEEAWKKSAEHFDYWWEIGNSDVPPLRTFIVHKEAYSEFSFGKGGDFVFPDFTI